MSVGRTKLTCRRSYFCRLHICWPGVDDFGVLFGSSAKGIGTSALCDGVFDVFTNSTIFVFGGTIAERSPWETFSFVRSACPERPFGAFCTSTILFLGMGLDEKRHPPLKANRGEAWHVCFLIALFLDEVVLTFIHSECSPKIARAS